MSCVGLKGFQDFGVLGFWEFGEEWELGFRD